MAGEGSLMKEEQMMIDYGFSVSVGNIIDSSVISSGSSETPPPQVIINNVKRKVAGQASNKIRKKMSSQTRTVKTTNLTDDGYGWRKYGQKIIHNQQHPKSYYRCTHHKEEKCEAKKWVQQESDSPPVYNSTYLGHHTCKNPLKIPQIFYPDYSSSSSTSSDNILESFDGSYSSMSTQPFILRFDSPGSNRISTHDVRAEQMASSPPLIQAVDSAESDTYGYQESCLFPSIPSPNCSFGSYDFNMMLEDYLLDLDNVNFTHDY